MSLIANIFYTNWKMTITGDATLDNEYQFIIWGSVVCCQRESLSAKSSINNVLGKSVLSIGNDSSTTSVRIKIKILVLYYFLDTKTFPHM